MDRSRISRSVVGCVKGGDVEVGDGDGEREREAADVRRSTPLRSDWWKRSSQGMGTKTQFSGLGKTPTGELTNARGGEAGQSSTMEGAKWDLGGSPNVCFYTCLLAFFYTRVQGYMHRLMRRCLLRIEILNQSRICIQIRPRRIPPNNDLLRINLMMQLIHRPMILHINRNLLTGLTMQNRERAPHFDCFCFTIAANPEEGTDDPVLVVFATEVVV